MEVLHDAQTQIQTANRERRERFLDILIQKPLPAHILMETHVGDILREADIPWKCREAGIVFIYMA